MQLTRHTDYALRLLITLADGEGTRMQIGAIAEAQAISRTHLMKIANELARAGFIEAVRGRGGGVKLARASEDINLADVVRAMAPTCAMAECASCRLIRRCNLPRILDRAASAFEATLANYSLADIIRERRSPAELRLVER
jgi:Rrf2 family nitric oxide-sensitive transcriptional repressor